MVETGKPIRQVIDYFRAKNVMIGRPFPPLNTHARITLGTPAEMQACEAMSSLAGGLGANGTLLVVGASAEPIEVSPLQLIMGRKRMNRNSRVRNSPIVPTNVA